MDAQYYNADGQILFRIGPKGIEKQVYDKNYFIEIEKQYFSDINVCTEMVDQRFQTRIYDLFDGKDFLEMVQQGSITDYDGCIACVFVDGRRSNLGLATDNLISSGFLVSKDVWLEFCDMYKVEVNWANK